MCPQHGWRSQQAHCYILHQLQLPNQAQGQTISKSIGDKGQPCLVPSVVCISFEQELFIFIFALRWLNIADIAFKNLSPNPIVVNIALRNRITSKLKAFWISNDKSTLGILFYFFGKILIHWESCESRKLNLCWASIRLDHLVYKSL